MRTGIYVYSSATLTFTASEPLVMRSYAHQNTTVSTTTWTVNATKGIYKVVSNAAISVTSGGDVAVVAEPNDKNPFPEPPPRAQSTFDVSSTDVQTFFVIANAKSAAF